MNVVELFCCSGGMAEGLRRAGLPVTEAFDFDDDACASYERNLGHKPIAIDVRDLLRMIRLGWRPSEMQDADTGELRGIDLLVADPPCVSWSRAGKRLGLNDPVDMLKETVAIVAALAPRHFLIANVPGLDDGPNWPVVQDLIGGLSRHGYCIDFARLDACDYGVPQHRVRPFWYGHPVGGPHVQWPAPTHADPDSLKTLPIPGVEPLTPWITCRQALGHLPPEQRGRPIRLRWRGSNGHQIASVPDAPARVVGTSALSDGNVLASPESAMRKSHKPSRRPRASHADAPAGTVTTTNNGNGGVLFDGPNHRPTHWDEPAKTLSRNTHSDGALLVEPELVGRARTDGSIREHAEDLPAHTIRGSRSTSERLIVESPRHPPNNLDEPARTLVAGDGGVASRILKTGVRELNGNERHRPADPDAPAPTLGAKDRGAQSAQAVSWPWDRPATTVTADDQGRLAPPGHHGKSFLSDNRGKGPNAIKLSELACKILQGFPENWHLAGRTKRARWSMLGQAMPPALAAAVGRSIKKAIDSARPKGAESNGDDSARPKGAESNGDDSARPKGADSNGDDSARPKGADSNAEGG